MLRYAISDRHQFSGSDEEKLQHIVAHAVLLAREGVDFFQIREKDLSSEALLTLTHEIRQAVRATGASMQIVLNGPRELASEAEVGWHRSADQDDSSPAVSTSCHTLQDIEAQRLRASLLLFGPVFEKRVHNTSVQRGVGLQMLRAAVQKAAGVPVLALGGVDPANASLCMDAGSAGIAAIRMFLRSRSTECSV